MTNLLSLDLHLTKVNDAVFMFKSLRTQSNTFMQLLNFVGSAMTFKSYMLVLSAI